MGSPRNYFRPDKQVDTAQTDQMYSSTHRKESKKEHARRQRQYDRKVIDANIAED